jgi:hypothetical protein
MPLTVIQGPLPNDFEIIHPDVDLENWINQSEIFGLGLGAFIDTPLNSRAFVVAASEAPPIQDSIAGILWFKRGEGRLYRYDQPDSPSTLTFTDKNWVALSDRKDIFVRAARSVQAGQLLAPVASPSNSDNLPTMTQQGGAVKYGARLIWMVASPGSGVSNRLPGVTWVALEAGSSGALIRVADYGFVDILTGSGDTGAAGTFCQRDAASLAYFAFSEVPTQATTFGRAFIGITTNSSATVTSDFFLRRAWKFVNVPWIPTGA